jgi:hypothetical protein
MYAGCASDRHYYSGILDAGIPIIITVAFTCYCHCNKMPSFTVCTQGVPVTSIRSPLITLGLLGFPESHRQDPQACDHTRCASCATTPAVLADVVRQRAWSFRAPPGGADPAPTYTYPQPESHRQDHQAPSLPPSLLPSWTAGAAHPVHSLRFLMERESHGQSEFESR